MTRKQVERYLAITVIASVLLAFIGATIVSTVVTFYPEIISDIKNLF